MSNYILQSGSTTTPITLIQAKEHLRLDSTDSSQDTYLETLINACTKIGEEYTRREFLTKSFILYLDTINSREIQIYRSKLVSISSVKYYYNSVLTTINSSNYYVLNSNDYSSLCFNSTFADLQIDDRKQAVQIAFTAGYGVNYTFIPSDIKLALLCHLAKVYENRGDTEFNISQTGIMLESMPEVTRNIYSYLKIRQI